MIKGYKQSKNGNFKVIDSIGVPHSYCIGTKLVSWAADNWNGFLGKEAIRDAEKHDIFCEICRKAHNKDYSKTILSYSEHKQALLVECKKDPSIKESELELNEYLRSIVDKATKENFAGFSFIKKF